MMLALGLGLACGALAASPFAWLARRETMTVRLRPLVTSGRRDPVSTPRRRRPSVPRPRVLASVLLVLGAPRARRRRRRSEASIVRELPVVVDIIGVAVSAGCTPYLAIEQAARYGPPRHRERAGRGAPSVRVGAVARRRVARSRRFGRGAPAVGRSLAHQRATWARPQLPRWRVSPPKCGPTRGVAPRPAPAPFPSVSASPSWPAFCRPSHCSPSLPSLSAGCAGESCTPPHHSFEEPLCRTCC